MNKTKTRGLREAAETVTRLLILLKMYRQLSALKVGTDRIEKESMDIVGESLNGLIGLWRLRMEHEWKWFGDCSEGDSDFAHGSDHYSDSEWLLSSWRDPWVIRASWTS